MTRNATFWDRRRGAVLAEEEASAANEQAALDAEQQEALARKTDEEVLAELGLPDPDTLAKGDDFAAFMAKAVPEHLRKRALRKLWRSNPVLACVDGLNDYDDDYLTGSFGNAPIQTSYQVGKGLLAHVLETMRADEAGDVMPLDNEEILTEDGVREDPEADVEDNVAVEVVETQMETPEFTKPRRMVFHFDGNSA